MQKRMLALCLAAAVAGCSGGGTQRPTPSPAPRNPIPFPLYANASIISVRSFKTNGGYSGSEVIAASTSSLDELSTWLAQVEASPPPRYQTQASQQRDGLDYSIFERKDSHGKRGVAVVVMDPQIVDRQFGAMLGMLDKYEALPAILRAPIDAAAKEQYGMTVAQATQPDNPIGAALAALRELRKRDARGIILIDALKK